MPRVLETTFITLEAGWTNNNVITMSTSENLVLIQARTAVDIRIATDKAEAASGNYFTVKSGTAQLLSSFNFSNERVFLWGAAGTVVEVLKQLQP